MPWIAPAADNNPSLEGQTNDMTGHEQRKCHQGPWPACLGDVHDISPLSALGASTCMAAVQHHLLLAFVSHHVLCSVRLTRCCILHSLGWGLHQALGVPLPLVVAPQGMPHQSCLCVLIMRDTQLHAEPPVWLSCIVLGGGWWHSCVTSSFLMGPLTTGWAMHCTRCWGAVPLGLAVWGGLYSSHTVCMGYGL
jgi:hypothetical protein